MVSILVTMIDKTRKQKKKENPRKYNHLIRVLIAMEKTKQKHWEKKEPS